ncbi:MAG: flagellar hook-associated protein 2 [Bradymonadia bacterium]|jgi:flagellar hook-associated protein 2
MIRGSGLISGLDTQSIIAQLVQLERQPIQRLETRRREAETQISALGTLSSRMNELGTLLEDLSEVSKLLSFTGSSSDETAFKVTADGTATGGSYAIEVSQLARPEKNRSAAFGTSFDGVSGTTLDITAFGEDPITIEIPDGATLIQARELINESGADVSAAIIDTGNGAYLSITSKSDGHEIGGAASDAIQITETVTGASGQALGLVEVQSARNAALTIDGLAVESASNTVVDAITGVTIELLGETLTPETLSLASDPDAVESKIQEFVDSYNGILKAIDDPRLESGSLQRLLKGDLAQTLSKAIPGIASFVNLSSVGVETVAETGKLSLDSEALVAAIASDPTGLAQLFAQSDDGIAANFTNLIERYTGSSGGLIKVSSDNLTGQIDRIEDQIINKERRLDSFEESLVRQYTNLELAIAQTQANFSGLF